MGKINRYYNLEVILEAVPHVLGSYPRTKFLLVGDGNNRYYLREFSRKLRVERSVVFTGLRPGQDIPNLVNYLPAKAGSLFWA